jgi:hypothetical protein
MATNDRNASAQTQHDDIVPFWNRLGEISRYPLHAGALITLIVLSVCRLVGFLPLGFIGWIFQLLTWVALYKYAFECLRATADGRMEPPEVAVSVDDSLGWSQIWLQVAFFLFSIVGFVLFGPVGGACVAILLALALPGAIMSLAMDQNLGNALNPATWMAIMSRLGGPYFAVAALYFVFGMSQSYAQSLVVPFLPPVISTFVFYFIGNYVVIATFHLMGYLIYQYHDEIGYEPAAAVAPLRRAIDDPDQNLLDEAAQHVREGRPEAACEVLAEQLRARGGSEAMHTQYRKLLVLLGRRDEQLRHGRAWISALLAQDKDRRSVDIARECIELDPAFQLADPDDVSRVARKAVDIGNTQVALRLVSTYLKAHPKHRDLPQNALLAAKVLAERMGKEDTARTLLDQVMQRFPQHALAEEISAYRKYLDKVGTQASPVRAPPL